MDFIFLIEILKNYGHICKEVARLDSINDTVSDTGYCTYIFTSIDTIKVT